MEVVEIPRQKNYFSSSETKQPNLKCTRKYIQPPRVRPFAPNRTFCPPKNPIDSKTTYHTSYYTDNQICESRPKPIIPVNSLNITNEKFSEDTTSKMSFKPVHGVFKAKAILPRQKICIHKTPMENLTTIRQDFEPKFIPKPQAILPCGNIRTNKGSFDTVTTNILSYMNPGFVKPVTSFKPIMKYCKPKETTAVMTTNKLSFLPFEIGKKENLPWATKPTYRRPEIHMPGETTYNKSYLLNNQERERPIMPRDTGVLPRDAEFLKSTVYKESFLLPNSSEPATPIVPSQNIVLSNNKMATDTTNKLSFQPIKCEKRKPILPRHRKILSDAGSIQNISVNQLSYTPKFVPKAEMIRPCGHIRTANKPMEDATTTALSFQIPGHTDKPVNFKPIIKYCKPAIKVETETVNKMSYQGWKVEPKEDHPWARKHSYCPPKLKIATDTVYYTSFPPPGQFVETCEESEVPESSGTPMQTNDGCNIEETH